MIFSIHIPKTAGTSFRMALEERYGDRLALYYGAQDPKTHPALKVDREQLLGPVSELAAQGVEVLHGHYPPRYVRPLITDPSRQVWTWLRDPVDRTLSHFAFFREREHRKKLAEKVKAGDVALAAFAKTQGVRDLQSSYLKGFELSDLAFVGVVEEFELGLALLFGEEAPALKRRYNATDAKWAVKTRARHRLASINARDMELYAEGLRLLVGRVAQAGGVEAPERPTAAGTGLVKRLVRKVA